MKNRRYRLINIAIEMLMVSFMYFFAKSTEPALGRVIIFLVGQLVTLLQFIILFLNDV